MINLKQALSIHQILIEKFGGAKGVKDQGALESALNRPYATFDQEDLYPTAIDIYINRPIFLRIGMVRVNPKSNKVCGAHPCNFLCCHTLFSGST